MFEVCFMILLCFKIWGIIDGQKCHILKQDFFHSYQKNTRSIHVQRALRDLKVFKNYNTHTHTKGKREKTWFLSGRQHWQGCWTHQQPAGNAGSLPHHSSSQYNHCHPHSQLFLSVSAFCKNTLNLSLHFHKIPKYFKPPVLLWRKESITMFRSLFFKKV